VRELWYLNYTEQLVNEERKIDCLRVLWEKDKIYAKENRIWHVGRNVKGIKRK